MNDDNFITFITFKYGLATCEILIDWFKSYKDNCYTIVENVRSRPSIIKKEKNNKSFEQMTTKEKLKYLENENTYLKAENEYLKKIRAVAQEREEQQLKKN